ncbi:MAG: phosphatase PAP2 family protein [Thermodesulfobacteriota bacterium]
MTPESSVFGERTSGLWLLWVFVASGVLLFPVRVYDREIFLCVNGLHSPWTDPLWLGLTTAGDGFLLAIVLGASVVVNPRVAALGLTLLVASSVVVHVIKAMADTPRPAAVLEGVHVLGPLLRGGSFPSGHSASAVSAAVAIAHFCPSRPGKALAITAGALIAISRVCVGAHFPSDVLAGMGIAAGLGFLALSWDGWKRFVPKIPTRGSLGFRAAVAMELAACVIGLSFYSAFLAEWGMVSAGISLGCLVFVCAGLGNVNALSGGNRRKKGLSPGHRNLSE